jgi:hypothetical protein
MAGYETDLSFMQVMVPCLLYIFSSYRYVSHYGGSEKIPSVGAVKLRASESHLTAGWKLQQGLWGRVSVTV